MKLWLVSQDENNDYDTFDSMVVAAPDEESARDTKPHHNDLLASGDHDTIDWGKAAAHRYGDWAFSRDKVEVTYIGEAAEGTPAGVIIASFNAG
jgi:hypothetical protein